MQKTWRQHFRPIIQAIIFENRGKTEKEIRKALRENKPADARTFSSVNAVWLDEVKKQLNALFPQKPNSGHTPTQNAGEQFALF